MTSKPSDSERQASFRRNEELEQMLALLNRSLEPAEELLTGQLLGDAKTHPIVFIMGPLRSGTTLLTQWLAATGVVACPTNLLSRFYRAPAVGAMIQLLLTDSRYNFRNEILDFNAPLDFQSENGKTRGALAPNEFWYFWRRFLPAGELDWWSDEQLFEAVDTESLTRELYAVSQVLQKPFALKGMILNYNIPFLDSLFDRALFIQTYRDPVANVASVLDARKRQYGDEDTWYSFRIPEYPELAGLDALHQCAGQVAYINGAVSRGLSQVDESRKLLVEYERFCERPAAVYEELLSKLALSPRDYPYRGAVRFEPGREVDGVAAARIEKALATFGP